MSKLSGILVPIDFPPTGAHVLEHAAAVAAHAGCELHVLHVQVFDRGHYGWSAVPDVEGIEKIISETSRRNMDKVVEAISLPVVDAIVKSPREASAILEHAEAHDCGLIVMGTHARKGVERMFMGSVTAEVLRRSPVSVMIIGPRHEAPAPDSYRRVLVPVDFSDSSREALRQASVIAEQHDARLMVVHAVEPPMSVPYDAHLVTADEMHDRAVGALEEFLADADLPRAAQDKLVMVGPPDDAIVSFADDESVDLIVMGTVGRSGLSRILLGSTTERVLRKAPCPVLAHRGEVLDNL
jgi:nucleotide-binding universal stress UspA family protein